MRCALVRIDNDRVRCAICDRIVKTKNDPASVYVNCKARGVGDVIKRVSHITGVDKLIKHIIHDCGCRQRQEVLNEYFPFRKGSGEI